MSIRLKKLRLKIPTIEKRSLIEDEDQDSDIIYESCEPLVKFITQGYNPKPKDQTKGSTEHCNESDNTFESLLTQEMFMTQADSKRRDQLQDSAEHCYDSDDLFDSPQTKEILTSEADPNPRHQWQGSEEHCPPSDPLQSQEIIVGTQMFTVTSGDSSPSGDPISVIVAGDDNQDQSCTSTPKKNTATNSSQTDLAFDHFQSQNSVNSCTSCKYLLQTSEAVRFLAWAIYQNSRLKNQVLSSHRSMVRNTRSQSTSTSPLKRREGLKENLETDLTNENKHLDDSGILDDEDSDLLTSCNVQMNIEGENKSSGAEKETKKRKLKDAKTKQQKKRIRERKQWKKKNKLAKDIQYRKRASNDQKTPKKNLVDTKDGTVKCSRLEKEGNKHTWFM